MARSTDRGFPRARREVLQPPDVGDRRRAASPPATHGDRKTAIAAAVAGRSLTSKHAVPHSAEQDLIRLAETIPGQPGAGAQCAPW